MTRKGIYTTLYFLKKVWNILIIKWKSTTKKSIKDYSTTPYINLRSSIQFTRDYLWSSIVWTSTASLQKMSIMHDIAQAKVSKFYIVL
uniref:SnrK1 n=1 Tax=Arundo donax TaxID=35708 RepID=A0A0A9BA91_ARUDO